MPTESERDRIVRRIGLVVKGEWEERKLVWYAGLGGVFVGVGILVRTLFV